MTLTDGEKKAKLQTMIDDVSEILKPEVLRIEAKPATTRNHYGDYMALLAIDGQTGDDAGKLVVMARALIQAGANRQGIADALKIISG